MFDVFWQATGERSFDAVAATCAECYRLAIQTSLTPRQRAYRIQRPLAGPPGFVAHFFVGADRGEAAVKTHAITLEEPLWSAFEALLAKTIADALVSQLRTEAAAHGVDVRTWLARKTDCEPARTS